jgi:5-methylcytosine-specific restriction endonuclease McrA
MRAQILAESDVCILCGHHGADAIDHIIPVAKGGTEERDNKAPIHGVTGCPTCGRKCNSEKGDRLLGEVRLATSRDWYSPPT